MANHNVTLNYTPANSQQDTARLVPTENPIRVHAGQTIAFHIGTGPSNARLRLTFADPTLFSTSNPNFHASGQFNDGDGDVTVVAPPSSRTTYQCELLVDGMVKAVSPDAGGEVVPDRP